MGAARSIDPDLCHRLNVEAYHKMIEAGIFGEDDRIELLDGILVTMAPQTSFHALTIQRLTRLLVKGLDDKLAVRVQLPLTLGGKSEPEPDVAVVGEDQTRGPGHPTTALLVIEVAFDSTTRAFLSS